MTSRLVLILAAVSLGYLASACQPNDTPIGLTPTQTTVQESDIQNTQESIAIEVTQTALNPERDVSETQMPIPTSSAAPNIFNPESQQLALTPVTTNADWTPIESDFDGVTMVLVPVGCFMMGLTLSYDNELLVHEQCFESPFWIDKYEVTNGQFEAFDGKKPRSNRWKGENRPIGTISWFDAKDFCAKRGARLPTEREWEYAARGPDNLKYPWGNTENENNAILYGNSNSQTADVGTRPAGASWVGALDLSGNVWEWTSTLFEAYPYELNDGREDPLTTRGVRVMRGGSFSETLDSRKGVAYRGSSTPSTFSAHIGMRCVRS